MLQDTNDSTHYIERRPSGGTTRPRERSKTPDGVTYYYDLTATVYKEDAFGNRIDAFPSPGRPDRGASGASCSISATARAGRSSSCTDRGRPVTVTANGRTWTYLYSGAGNGRDRPDRCHLDVHSEAATLPAEYQANAMNPHHDQPDRRLGPVPRSHTTMREPAPRPEPASAAAVRTAAVRHGRSPASDAGGGADVTPRR